MLLTRRMVPFFVLGFVLAAYLKMRSLGVALLGVAAVIFFEWTRHQDPAPARNVESSTLAGRHATGANHRRRFNG